MWISVYLNPIFGENVLNRRLSLNGWLNLLMLEQFSVFTGFPVYRYLIVTKRNGEKIATAQSRFLDHKKPLLQGF